MFDLPKQKEFNFISNRIYFADLVGAVHQLTFSTPKNKYYPTTLCFLHLKERDFKNWTEWCAKFELEVIKPGQCLSNFLKNTAWHICTYFILYSLYPKLANCVCIEREKWGNSKTVRWQKMFYGVTYHSSSSNGTIAKSNLPTISKTTHMVILLPSTESTVSALVLHVSCRAIRGWKTIVKKYR